MSQTVSEDGYGPARFITNVFAIMVTAITIGWLYDKAAGLIGYHPALLCGSVVPFVQQVFGHLAGMALAIIGLVGLAFSGFRSGPMIVLTVGGLFLGVAPSLILHYLGLVCP